MSFSSEVKKELCGVPVTKKNVKRAELAGIIYLNSTLGISKEGPCLIINTESMDVVKRVISLYKTLYDIEAELMLKDAQLKKTSTYIVSIYGKNVVLDILHDIGLELLGGVSVNQERYQEVIFDSGCREAFARGAFLGSGSIIDPEKEKHLEIVAAREAVAEALFELFVFMGLNVKKTLRKLNYVIYFKQTESIISFLTIVGAHAAVLKLESIQIYKEIKNNINRQVNFEQANQDRTINSAQESISNIKKIIRTIGLDDLPKGLQEAAILRMDYPEATLSELAQISGKTTKSGINHRLRRLNDIAQAISERGGREDDLQGDKN